jgi:ammonium transporter Rh
MRPILAVFFAIIQVVIIILYLTACNIKLTTYEFSDDYGVFQDVQVMIFIGFGFLMVFLKSYSWSAVGFNFLTAALATEVVPLWTGFWQLIFENRAEKIDIDVWMLVRAEFGAAAVLITMGAVLGKVNDAQLCFIAITETFFYTLNEAISLNSIYASDVGGMSKANSF